MTVPEHLTQSTPTTSAADGATARLRRVASYDADTRTLVLMPSASEPMVTTVRLCPNTVVTGPGGEALAPATLAHAAVVTLRVELQADGTVLATAVAVHSFTPTTPRVLAELAHPA